MTVKSSKNKCEEYTTCRTFSLQITVKKNVILFCMWRLPFNYIIIVLYSLVYMHKSVRVLEFFHTYMLVKIREKNYGTYTV